MRAIVLAIVVATALAGGGPMVSASATTTGPALVAEANPFGGAVSDPSDPGLPPD